MPLEASPSTHQTIPGKSFLRHMAQLMRDMCLEMFDIHVCTDLATLVQVSFSLTINASHNKLILHHHW
jgi:hypothetical protein